VLIAPPLPQQLWLPLGTLWRGHTPWRWGPERASALSGVAQPSGATTARTIAHAHRTADRAGVPLSARWHAQHRGTRSSCRASGWHRLRRQTRKLFARLSGCEAAARATWRQRGLTEEIRQRGRLGTLLSARLRASAVHAPTPIAARPEKRRPRASRAGCDPPPPLPHSVWMPCATALWRHRRAPLERRVLSSRRDPSYTSCLLSRRARRSR
jgi:hypothetical protein